MTQIPIFVIGLCYLAQTTQDTQSPKADSTSQVSQAEQYSEADKFVIEAAEAVDAIEYVSAKLRQTIRAAGKSIESTGTYLRGPNSRSRLDLFIDIGSGKATRVNASDGSTCSMYESILDNETYETFDVKQVMPLLETREISPEIRQQFFLFRLPFDSPGEMLRGYLKSMQFHSVSDTTLGDPPRPVSVVEGRWRDTFIPVVAQDQSATQIEDLPEGTPQFIRLYLDKETRFPLRVDLYRKSDRAAYRPMFQLEFDEVHTDKIPDNAFAFQPPSTVTPVDVTSEYLRILSQLPEKTTSEPKTATDSIAEPLQTSPAPQ